MAKPWEIDFGDVEKALGLSKKEIGPPAPDLNSPDPGRDHLAQQLQQVAAQQQQDLNSPDPGRAALTQQMNDTYQWDKIGQELWLTPSFGDTEQLSAPTQELQYPTSDYRAPNQWDQVAEDLRRTPDFDVQLTTAPIDTGATSLDTQQAAQPTITSPIVTGQENLDSAGQAPSGGWIDTVGNAILSPVAGMADTPGYRAMNQRNENMIAAAGDDGLTPMESIKQAGLTALNFLGLPADAVKTTEIPGLGVSPGQLAKVLVGTSDKVYDAPTLGGQLSQVWGDIQQGVNQWYGLNRRIEALPEAIRPDAELSLLGVYSGFNTVESNLNDIVNKDAAIASLVDRARQAQNIGDDITAAQLGAQAEDLRNTSAVEIVDNKTSILPELGYTAVLDPLNAVGAVFKLVGLTPEAMKAANAARLFDVTPSEALERLPGAVADAIDAVDIVKQGGSLLSWWEKVNPFARTAESLAAKDNNILYRMAASLFGDVSTKQDAQAIVTALVENPERLVKGLYNLTSEGLANRVDKAGKVAFDAGVVANNEVLEAMKVLQLAGDRLKQMISYAGEGGLNKLEFLSEFDDIISEAARRTYGLDKLIDLPVGTKVAELVKNGKTTGFIKFVDAQGREAGRTTEMALKAAESRLADLKKAINATGGNFNLLRDAAQAQRAIMSEIWLNMRPGHWATNAVSAYTHLFVDGLYTFKKTGDIVDDLMQLTGGLLPSGRVAEAVQGGEAVQSLFRKIPVVGRPLAAFSELGAQIKGGNMALFNRLAVGEQNFYMRAYHTAFRRVFNQQWERTVSQELTQVFQRLGVDSQVAKELVSVATEAALRGGKQEMINAFRTAVNNVQTSFTLNKFGILPEDITVQGQKALHELFQNRPATIQQTILEINKIFKQESRRWQEILKQSQPEMGRYAFTTLEHMNDAADITDDLNRAAKLAKIDPAGAPGQVAKAVTDVEQGIYNSLFYELGGSTDPAQLNIAIDMWGQLHEAKQAVRQRLGALADETIQAGTDAAWARYFATARQEWDNYAQRAQEVGDQARIAIQSGQPMAQRFDAWEMIESYSMTDEAELLQLRQQGFDIERTADQQERFKRVLEAQRKFVDSYVGQTFSIFHRYPSLDSLDVVVSAQRDVDRLGARAAAYVAEARDKLFANEMTLGEYYSLRNQTWYELADAQATRWQVATREIVFNGEKEKFPTKLRWTDNFAGGDFELLRPVQQGDRTFWYARRVDDGTTHRFLDPMDKGGALPPVPQSVINDYNRMTGELDKLVDTVAEAAKSPMAAVASTPTSNPVMGQGSATEVANFERQNPLFAAANAEPIPGGLPPEPKVLERFQPAPYEGNVSDLTRMELDTLREAKQAMQVEWDKAAGHFKDMPSLQTMTAMLQTRTGGGTPNINIGGVRWDDSSVVREFAEMMFGPNGTGEDLIKWLRDYSKLNADIDTAGASIREGKRFVGMTAEQVLDEAKGILPVDVIEDLRKGNANRQEIIDTINAYVNDEGLKTYDFAVPAIDTKAIDKAAEAARNIDLGAYVLDAKKQLTKWFDVQGDGIKDLYKAIQETNNGRAALGGTWQPGIGDYADYMNRRAEAARRKIIQNLESILNGAPNTLTPQQRLRAFDSLVTVSRQYDNALGVASKAANDMADFAMLNFADRRNIDNLIGMWTPYHFWFTRSMKNWIERSALKPSLLANYYKAKRAADLHAQQNDLPDRLAGKTPIGRWGGEDRYIPNPVEIMLPYNVYGLKGFDDPEEASNGWERAYMYAQMLGFGALPVYDAAIKYASGKGNTIQIGDYIPQYRAINYLYQSITGRSLPGGGDEFDPYRTGRQAGMEAIRGNTTPTLAQWAQDIAYQVMEDVGALPEQPKEAQAVYEAAAKAAGWDVALAKLGSFFLGIGLYTYTDAEKAAREAQKTYHSLAYSEDGNAFGSREAMNASRPDWYSAWQSKASLAPGASESNPNGETIRPGAIASFNEMSQAKDQLNAQQNGEIDKFILDQTAAGTPIAEIQSEVWKIIKRYSNQRDNIEAAHPSAALPSSDNPYYGYNPKELGEKAYTEAVRKAKEQMGDMPDYPKDGTNEQKRAWVEGKKLYDQQLLSLVNGYMQDPSALVGGNKVDTSKLPTDPADVVRLYDQRYMTPIQKQLADAVTAEKAAKAQEFSKYNQNWNEYNKLGNDYDAKRRYLTEHPEFAVYLAGRYKGKGYDAWWLKERKQGGGRSYSGRPSGSRGGRGYGGRNNVSYSTLFPSIAAWAQRTPKAPGVSNTVNPILWQMTGRRYGSK